MNRIIRSVWIGVAASSLGCQSGIADPEPQVAMVRLQPAVLQLDREHGQAAVMISAFNARGQHLEPAPPILLFVRDTTIAELTAPGLVTARQPGVTYLVAVAAGAPDAARDSVLVRVGSFTSLVAADVR